MNGMCQVPPIYQKECIKKLPTPNASFETKRKQVCRNLFGTDKSGESDVLLNNEIQRQSEEFSKRYKFIDIPNTTTSQHENIIKMPPLIEKEMQKHEKYLLNKMQFEIPTNQREQQQEQQEQKIEQTTVLPSKIRAKNLKDVKKKEKEKQMKITERFGKRKKSVFAPNNTRSVISAIQIENITNAIQFEHKEKSIDECVPKESTEMNANLLQSMKESVQNEFESKFELTKSTNVSDC